MSSRPLATALALLGAVLVGLPAVASEPLTADQAAALALARSPALEVLQDQLVEDQVLVRTANEIANPTLRVASESSELFFPAIEGRPYSADPVRNTNVALRWSPPNLSAWPTRQARAERHVDQSQAQLQQAQRDLVARVRTLHTTLLNIEQELALEATGLELRDKQRTLITRRLENQAATGLDRNLAELDYSETVLDLQELQSSQRQSYGTLLALLGVSADTQYVLVAGSNDGCTLPRQALPELFAQAHAHNPAFASIQAEIDEVDADIARAYFELIPWFDYVQLGVALGESDTRFAFGTADNKNAALRFGLGIRFPLFNWNQDEIAVLKARRQKLEAQRRATAYDIENRVQRVVEELRGRVFLLQRHGAADQSVVDDSLRQINRALDLGEADPVQMALLQSRTLAARRAYLRASLRCQESVIELERLTGDTLNGAAPQSSSAPATLPVPPSTASTGAAHENE